MTVVKGALGPKLRGATAVVSLVFALSTGAASAATLDITHATIPEFQAAYVTGRLTAERVTAAYLARITAYDKAGPAINAVIHLNPNALAQAKALDAERKAGKVRGPLHGIPIVLKDNIDTFDLETTAGSQLLAGWIPPKDAFVMQKLRDAGAIVIAKVNMQEFARSANGGQPGLSSGGGQTHNPHDLERSPSASSGGTGASIAAAFAEFGLGTDSISSVRGPAAANGVVALKTTHGLISKTGVIPLTLSTDIVGPMARNVTDLAYALNAMVGVDPADKDTLDSVGQAPSDYTRFLKADALKGARIGIGRQFIGGDAEIDKIIASTIEVLKQKGAVIVDPVMVPEHLMSGGRPIWGYLERAEFKADVTTYLKDLPPKYPHSFDDLVRMSNDPATNYNSPPKAAALKALSEQIVERSDPDYIALTKVMLPAFTVSINAVFQKYNLTAMLFPTTNTQTPKLGARPPADPNRTPPASTGAASIGSDTGFPEVVVPAGMSADNQMPITVSLLGPAWSDGQLIGLAYAFEQATHAIRMPKLTPTLKTDVLRY